MTGKHSRNGLPDLPEYSMTTLHFYPLGHSSFVLTSWNNLTSPSSRRTSPKIKFVPEFTRPRIRAAGQCQLKSMALTCKDLQIHKTSPKPRLWKRLWMASWDSE